MSSGENDNDSKMSPNDFLEKYDDEISDTDGGSVNTNVDAESFCHYLFLKTDFSLNRLSRKLVKQLNNISLNDDDDEDGNDDTEQNERHPKKSVHNLDRRRSISLDGKGQAIHNTGRRRTYHRLNRASSSKVGRNKHGYNDWLEDHKTTKHGPDDLTKIIRIDITEIDQVNSTDIHNVNYLSDLFNESGIDKFYTFDSGKFSSKGFYLATNVNLSTSSLNSEMSENTFNRASIKKKNKKARKPKAKKTNHNKKPNHNHHLQSGHHSSHSRGNSGGHSRGRSNEEHKHHNKKKGGHGLIRQATSNLIKYGQRSRRQLTSDLSVESEYSGDLRSYHSKKNDIQDGDLHMFLASGRMNKRRNAIVHKIDTLYKDGELHTFMENQLRQNYIETFLL